MASFTRKRLRALGITDEDTIDSIMEMHTAVTDALTSERDQYRTEAEKVPQLTADLEAAQAAGKDKDGKDYKTLYTGLVKQIDAEKGRAEKAKVFRKLAAEAGVSDKYIDTVVKASAADIDALVLEGDKAKDSDTIVAGLKDTWADFIPVEATHSPGVKTPPANTGGGKTREEIMAITDTVERQQAIADNMDLFE